MKQEVTAKKVFIRTLGWQMDAVLYDFCALFEQDLVSCMDGTSTDYGGDIRGVGEIRIIKQL